MCFCLVELRIANVGIIYEKGINVWHQAKQSVEDLRNSLDEQQAFSGLRRGGEGSPLYLPWSTCVCVCVCVCISRCVENVFSEHEYNMVCRGFLMIPAVRQQTFSYTMSWLLSV